MTSAPKTDTSKAGHTAGILVLIAAITFSLSAQSRPGISGHVRDTSGGAVGNAKLSLFRQDTGVSSNTATGPGGEYRFDGVAPGALVLEIQKEGFRTATINVAFEGSVRPVDVTLEVAGVNQTVVVTAAGEAQTLDEVSKAFSSISHEEI